jgi:hypothetical protein
MLAALALVAVQSAAVASPLAPVPKELSAAFARVWARAPGFAGVPGRSSKRRCRARRRT